MRDIVDNIVIDRCCNDFFTREQDIIKLRSQYPGKVRDTSTNTFVKYSAVNAADLSEQVKVAADGIRVPEAKTRYQLALIGLVNTGSLYLSIAAQYLLYKITTAEIEPVEIEAKLGKVSIDPNFKLDMPLLKGVLKILEHTYEEYVGDSHTGGNLVDVVTF